MAKIIEFPAPKGVHLASIDLFREPDGTILARVGDMSPRVIDAMGGEVWEKMLEIALWTMKGSESLAEQATGLRPPE